MARGKGMIARARYGALRRALLLLLFAATPGWLEARPDVRVLPLEQGASSDAQSDCDRWKVRVRNRGEFAWAAYTYVGESRPDREVPLDSRRLRGAFLGNIGPAETHSFFLPAAQARIWLEIVLTVSTGFQPRPIVLFPSDSIADRYRGPDGPDVDFECEADP